MIVESYYLSNLSSLQIANYTDLSLDEVESIVGRFTSRSRWAGKLRGELRIHACGKVEIFNNFKTKKNPRKVLWSSNEIDF